MALLNLKPLRIGWPPFRINVGQGSPDPDPDPDPVPAAPAFTLYPSLSGAPVIGATLAMTAGEVSGYPAPVVTWRWQYSADGNAPWLAFRDEGLAHDVVLQPEDAGIHIRGQAIARNSEGDSGWVTLSPAGGLGPVAAVSPDPAVPAQPLPSILTATGPTSISVAMTMPHDGGSPLTRIQIGHRQWPGSSATWSTETVLMADLANPCLIEGLLPDSPYEVRFRVQNSVGYGPQSQTASVTTRPE